MSDIVWSPLNDAIFEAGETTSDNLQIIATAGSGKCLGRGEKVLLYSGELCAVENIKPGDQLYGPDSTPRTVVSTTKGHGPLYRIIPTKGESWVCNEDHILVLYQWKNKKTYDISLRDILTQKSHSRFHKKSTYRDYKLLRTPVEFPQSEVSFDAYVIGLWLGDGTRNGPRITTKDFASRTSLRCTYQEKNGCTSIDFSHNKNGERKPNPLRSFLKEHCLTEDRQKKIPSSYLLNSTNIRLELLAGLLDSDGHYSRGTYDFITKFSTLKDDVLYLCRSLGFAAYAKKATKTIKSLNFSGEYWRISISGNLERIPCRLLRKKAAPRQQIKNVLHTGFRIEPLGDGEYFGFELDKDGRFLLGDFTITHNSTTLFELVNRLSATHTKKNSIGFLAFGKAIADYAKSKIGNRPQVAVRTFHAQGLVTLRAFLGEVPPVVETKVADLVKKLYPYDREKYQNTFYPKWAVQRLVRILRQKSLLTYEEEAIASFIESEYALWSYDKEKDANCRQWCLSHLSEISEVLQLLDNDFDCIDMDDMVRLPAVHNMISRLKWKPFSLVLIDEFQDVNGYQIAFINQLLKKKVRVIAVGDPQQAIFAFRSYYKRDPMSYIKGNFVQLPLNLSYRVPSNVVDFVRQEIPDTTIEAKFSGGEVKEIWKDDIPLIVKESNVKMIIGAKNASLVSLWIRLAREQINGTLKKVGIVDKIRALLSDTKPKSLQDLETSIRMILAESRDEDGESTLPQKHQDLFDCILCLISELNLENLGELTETLDKMELSSSLSLETVHSAKGLEAESIIVLQDWFKNPQLENMRFVAYTRTKNNLFLVQDWDKEERVY